MKTNQTPNLSTKTVRFIDNGLYVDFARLISKSFGRAEYYCPWESYCPTSRQAIIGEGFDEMERIKYPLKNSDSVDLWVFFDVYHADLQETIASQGGRVFGPRYGEEMELYRWEFRQFLQKLNLPVVYAEKCVGMKALREYLKGKSPPKYVKTSFVRGDFETFRHDSYVLSEPRLDEIAHLIGPLQEGYEFIVEDEIPDAVEVGYDGVVIDGQWPSHAMMAYEVKDVGMIGTTKKYEELAAPVRLVNAKLTPALRDYNYRGFLSTEIRYTKKKEAYLIDPCCRLGSPSNELLQVLFDDWPMVLWHGAEGTVYTPKPRAGAKFGVLATIHSEWANENWQAVHYPKEVEEWVKLRFHCKIENTNYTVPQPVGLPFPGVVVGIGETLIEAVKHCKSNACQVKGYGIDVTLEGVEKALDVIKKGEERGVKFAEKLPTAVELAKV